MKERTMMKSAGMVTILLLLSRLLGFAREAAIGANYSSDVTDAYFMASSLPIILFLAFNDSVKTAFIPVYGEYHNKEEGKVFASTVYMILTVTLVVITALMLLFTPQIMRLMAPGFFTNNQEKFALTVTLTQIMLPGLMFMGLSGLSSGVLHIKKNFFIPAITAFPNNIVIIFVAVFAGARYGILGLAWATLAGFAMQFLVQVPAVAGHGIFSAKKMMLRHPGIKKMALLLPPVIIGGAAVETKTLVDRIFGSYLAESSISALNYANKIQLLPNGIIVLALLTVIYPTLVELFNEKKMEQFKDTLRQGIGMMITLMFPIMVGFMVLSVPITRAIFERGKFTPALTQFTAFALVFYSLGLLPMGVMLLLNRAFYATQDTKTPMYFTFVTMVLNIFLNWALIGPLAHGGLALGTSISIYIGAIGMMYFLWKRIGAFGGRRIMDTLWKSGVASAVMGVVVWLSRPNLLADGFLLQGLQLGIVVSIGALVYFALAYLLKIEELDLVLAIVRRRFKVPGRR